MNIWPAPSQKYREFKRIPSPETKYNKPRVQVIRKSRICYSESLPYRQFFLVALREHFSNEVLLTKVIQFKNG